MEQWQTVGQIVGLAKVVKDGRAEGRDDLVAMGMCDQLWQTGRPAGVEVGGNVVVATGISGCENFSILDGQSRCEFNDAFRQWRIGHRNPNELETRKQSLDRERLLPDIELRMRPQRHQNFRAGSLDQLGDILGLQQKVDRHRIAGGLRTPQGEMGFDQAWQDVGHARRRSADGRKQIGRPGYAFKQLTVGNQPRLLVILSRHHHGQRGMVRIPRRTFREYVIDAAGVVTLRKRLFVFEPDHVR